MRIPYQLLRLPLEGTMFTVSWMMAKTSRSSALTGSMLTFGSNGVTLGSNAFHKVCKLSDVYVRLAYGAYTEPLEEPEAEDPAKMNTKPIPVPLDDAGFPELPPTTQNDNNKTKIVQSMLREYCTAHARELYLNVFSERFLTHTSKALSLERRARLFHGAH
jgi:hypothetical protein